MRSLFVRRGTAAFAAAVTALGLAACSNPSGVGSSQDTAEEASVPSRVEMLIPYSEGGGTDTWARFLAPYLEAHVAKDVSFTPKNVPGGESITGSNQFVQQGGTDGASVLVTSGTTYFQALLGRPEVTFDFAKMRPLMLNGTGGVIYTSKDSGITSVKDLANPPKPLKYGGISSTGLDLCLLQAFDVLGVEIDATFGFEGRGPARLALERGEVNIDYQTTSAYLTQVQPLVDAGTAIPLMSFGVLEDGKIVRDPNVPDLPTVEEVYKELNGSEPTGEAYEAYRAFLVPGFVYQKGIWANEGTPDSIVQAFWDAVEPIGADPKFAAASEDVLGGYPLYSGEEAKEDLIKAFQIRPEVRQYTLDLLASKYDTTIKTS